MREEIVDRMNKDREKEGRDTGILKDHAEVK